MTLQDEIVESIAIVAGIYFRSVRLPYAGISIPQHTHDYDHATLVCQGRARAFCNGQSLGEKGPGEAFEIRAGEQHRFESLEPNTILTCVHHAESAMSIQRKGL